MKYPFLVILSFSTFLTFSVSAFECSDIDKSVCGSDGATYKNICLLETEKVLLDYQGDCFPVDFVAVDSFSEAVRLFDLKKNQLTPNYSEGRENLSDVLSGVNHQLHSYNFSTAVHDELITVLNDFFVATQDYHTLSQQEEYAALLNLSVLTVKEKSAQTKYESGVIPFYDTDEGDWFTPFVSFLKEKSWISGYKDRLGNLTGKFEPAGLVTKAEVTKMAFRMAGQEEDIVKTPENLLAQDHWSAHWVALAEEQGISLWTIGTDPNQKATRAEVLRLIYEVLGLAPATSTQSDFPDVATSDRYFPYIQGAKNNGIISGYPDGRFQPDENISRAEISKIIKKSFEILAPQKVPVEKTVSQTIDGKVLSLEKILPEQYEAYAKEYQSEPFEFGMKVPGFFRFKAFETEENEIMRFGFSRATEVTESNIDFWLKIIGTEVPVTRFIQKKMSGQIILEFPREGFSKSFFRLEGSEDFSQIMYFLQKSIEYTEGEKEVIEATEVAPKKTEIPSAIIENLGDSAADCLGRSSVDSNGITRCYLKTSDIGDTCRSSSDCESEVCMAPQNGGVEGACYGEVPLSGCVNTINDGVVTEVCD